MNGKKYTREFFLFVSPFFLFLTHYIYDLEIKYVYHSFEVV